MLVFKSSSAHARVHEAVNASLADDLPTLESKLKAHEAAQVEASQRLTEATQALREALTDSRLVRAVGEHRKGEFELAVRIEDQPAVLAELDEQPVVGPGGLVHLSLQNPDSIHRLVALEMGLIDDVREDFARGDRFGTLDLWGADDLARLARAAGLGVVACEGVMLKPLPNAMMAELPPEVLDGFEAAARHLPAHCAVNLLVLARG